MDKNTFTHDDLDGCSRRTQDENERMDEDGCQFPANLTREEYIRFNLLIARTSGALRHQKAQLVFLVLMLVLGFGILLISKFVYNYVDAFLIVVMLILMVMAVVLYGGMPGYIRRAAARAYDQTVRQGYTYYGTVYVTKDKMVKRSRMSQVTIQYTEKVSFIESQDMLVLSEPGNKAIVLPARCLTKEDADSVRQCVLGKVNREKQHVLGRLIPRAAARMDASGNEPDDTELLTIAVQYTQQEFVSMVTDKSMKGFIRTLPVYGTISILTGMLIGLLYGYYWGMILFVSMITAIFLLTVGMARLRAFLSVRRMPPDALTIRIGLSEKGMTIRSPRQAERLEYIWPMVSSAVERSNAVDFQAGNTFLRIPKRCIPDLQALKDLVDRHLGDPSGK